MASDRKYLELRVSYRSILVVFAVTLVVAVAVALMTAWAAGTREAVVVGSAGNIGSGVRLDSCGPGSDDVLYPSGKGVVAVQTVRNDGRWAVEVVSEQPEVFRFGRLAEHPRDDVTLPDLPAGAPDDEETSDRVVIPPGREVAMWMVDPLPEATISGGYTSIETVPVMVGSLGVSHATAIELRDTIWVGGGEFDKDRVEAAFEEACAELNG